MDLFKFRHLLEYYDLFDISHLLEYYDLFDIRHLLEYYDLFDISYVKRIRLNIIINNIYMKDSPYNLNKQNNNNYSVAI